MYPKYIICIVAIFVIVDGSYFAQLSQLNKTFEISGPSKGVAIKTNTQPPVFEKTLLSNFKESLIIAYRTSMTTTRISPSLVVSEYVYKLFIFHS